VAAVSFFSYGACMKIEEAARLIQTCIDRVITANGVRLVQSAFDRDHDGDDIIRILICFDLSSDISPLEGLSLKRELRNSLLQAGFNAFPIVTFISSDELKDYAPEAA
jgi:hypothetical protein